MRVVELVIDGFKSYAVRTVISGWDDKFNAITGLNGSGKSNILDAICFVLGITNMSTVRAQNIQDLIYKRGQAGVTKASVTIVFDNSDKNKSPIGFEEYNQISVTRQIVMGGTTKYLINGHRAQQQTVQNLFQSVGLNVNNPNFLIMQGRITKVLNMKSMEVLALIEEAAGTRMFEERRDRALKTMAKKDTKLQEIQGLLREEIEPKLEKLRGEKRAFLDFQQAQTEVERLTRIVTAYDWWESNNRKKILEEELLSADETRKDMTTRGKQIVGELAALEEELARVKEVIAKELSDGGMDSLEGQYKSASNEVVRLTTALELKQKGAEESEQNQQRLQTKLQESQERLERTKEETKNQEHNWVQIHQKRKELEKELEEREGLLQTAMTGVSEKGGDGMGFEGQVNAAKQRVGSAIATEQQGLKRMAMLKERQLKNSGKVSKAKAEFIALERERDRLRAELEGMVAELGDSGNESEIRAEEGKLQQEKRGLYAKRDELKGFIGSIDFQFADPFPGFDRGKVKGVLAKLFEVIDLGKLSTAIEVCAGGRLWNVVVDSSETGAALLEKGQLARRVTLIPLDKISSSVADPSRVQSAKNIAPDKVELALDLIQYDPKLQSAMKYVFGNTLVAEDGDTAKQVTFNQAVRLRSVTVDGDVYDPSGTLSGGSRQRKNKVLDVVANVLQIEVRIAEVEKRLVELHTVLRQLELKKELRNACEVKRAEIEMLESQLETGTAAETVKAAQEVESEITKLSSDVEQARAEREQAEEAVSRAQQELDAFGKDRGGTLALLEQTVKQLRGEVKRAQKAVQPLEEQRREALAEVELAEGELSSAQEELEAEGGALAGLFDDIRALTREIDAAKERAADFENQLADERDRVTGHRDELHGLESAKRAKNKEKADAELAVKQAEIALGRSEKEVTGLGQRIQALEEQHEWIAEEKELFGREGGRYDFGDGRAMSAQKHQLGSLVGRFTAMKRRINPKVMNMIDSVEKKEASLKTMMRTVVRDKKKIEETITTLDEYKREALARAWHAVNRDFGAIFSEVLPGSFAKLEPVKGPGGTAETGTDGLRQQSLPFERTDGAGADSELSEQQLRTIDLSAGLAIRVRLGTIWKSSLAELSGGQRSLIALSLILALLQSRPAPMYILDEVDAALDLSHTQNIGTLIRTRFGGAQFIVVSLKDGMWANANRVFRTTFVGGTSVVRAS